MYVRPTTSDIAHCAPQMTTSAHLVTAVHITDSSGKRCSISSHSSLLYRCIYHTIPHVCITGN